MAREPDPQTTEQAEPKGDTSILNSMAFRGVAYQVMLAVLVVLGGLYLYSNVNANLERQGIATGWDFVTENAGFDIGESPIEYDSEDSYGKAMFVGFLNTLRVAFVGIILASVLGIFMGIARTSTNWLLSKVASIYVEVCRNVPVVLHVLFWATVVRFLPHPKQAISPFEGAYLMNRGVVFPIPSPDPAYAWVGAAFVIGVVAAIVLGRWAKRRRELTGQYIATFWWGLAIILSLPLATWLAFGAPLVWDVPALRGFNFQGGHGHVAGIRGPGGRGHGLYGGLYRRNRPRRNSVGRPWPDRGGPGARAPGRFHHALHHHSAGTPGNCAADGEPISEPDQELGLGRSDWISGAGQCRQHDLKPDRSGGGGHFHHDDRLFDHQFDHLGLHEPI